MPETAILLTPLHFVYLLGVIVILAVMVLRKDTPAVCIVFLFIIGLISLQSIAGAIQVVFRSILYAAVEFMEIIVTIASVTALSKCLSDLGSDYVIMAPMSKIMKKPDVTWWVLGLSMLLFSLFLWPSPAVALVGAIMLPIAVKTGISPLSAAVAMNLFGHGIALSYDFIIQGAPSISAGAAGVTTSAVMTEGCPLFLTMGAVTVITAYFMNRHSFSIPSPALISTLKKQRPKPTNAAVVIAILTPAVFIGDVIVLLLLDLKGGDATSLVSGSAVLLMCIGAALGFKKDSLEKITGYVTDGFLFAIKIFAPVIIIGAYFFLGGEGISTVIGKQYQTGIMNDLAIWLAYNTPLNKYLVAFIQLFIGGLTGLDGSGFSGLPLTGSLANTFGSAVDISIPMLAALGQISAVFVGGGTIVPWGIIPVAAICNVNPIDLARKNFLPVLLGLLSTFLVACLLLKA